MVNQPTKKTEVFLSLGSNIDPEQNLKYACRELKKAFGNIQISSVYRNKPIGFEGNDFLNIVVKVKSSFNPNEMLDYLRGLEAATGKDIGIGALIPEHWILTCFFLAVLSTQKSHSRFPEMT